MPLPTPHDGLTDRPLQPREPDGGPPARHPSLSGAAAFVLGLALWYWGLSPQVDPLRFGRRETVLCALAAVGAVGAVGVGLGVRAVRLEGSWLGGLGLALNALVVLASTIGLARWAF